MTDVLGLIVDKKEEILDDEIEATDRRASGSKKSRRTLQEPMRSVMNWLAKGIVLLGYQRRSKMEKSIKWDFDTCMQEMFQMQEVEAETYSPLALAYIGDCIFDLVIKNLVLNRGNKQVKKLHKETSQIVQASTVSRK